MNVLSKVTLSFILIFTLLLMPSISYAAIYEKPQSIDIRVLSLHYYLKNYDSPLADHAELLIKLADKYDLDWKLIPSIAAVESNFGHKIPGGKDPDYTSHNAWGWGVYGTKVTSFRSWEEGIDTVVRGVKLKFVDIGLNTPKRMNIKYSSNPDWYWQVEFFINELNTYTKTFDKKFGEQIAQYNQSLIDQKVQEQDAKRYDLPPAHVIVDQHRMSIL
jgi:hypothetical protein